LASTNGLYPKSFEVAWSPPSTNPVAHMTALDKVKQTSSSGIAIAGKEAGGGLGKYLSDPKNVAALGTSAAIIGGAQFIPGVDGAVDIGLGVVGAGTYAAAAPEHRENITKALGKLKDYAGEVAVRKRKAISTRPRATSPTF